MLTLGSTDKGAIMKILFYLIALVTSTVAYSCPQLSGNWKCLDELNKPRYIEITQNELRYNIKEKNSLSSALEVFADGKEREENTFIFRTKTLAKCNQNNTLNIYQERKVLSEGLKSESHTNMDFSLIDDNSYTCKTVSDTQFDGQEPQHGEQTYHCVKLK